MGLLMATALATDEVDGAAAQHSTLAVQDSKAEQHSSAAQQSKRAVQDSTAEQECSTTQHTTPQQSRAALQTYPQISSSTAHELHAICAYTCVLLVRCSSQVIRLTAETLQGAGTILSYHTSVLMADHHGPTATTSNNNTSSSSKTVAAAAAATAGATAAAAAASARGLDVHITAHASLHAAPAAYHGKAGASGAHLAAAAAAAAVAAAREHEHATLEWVDVQEQQAPATIAATIGSAGPKSSVKSIAGSSVGSSGSTGTRSESSLDGLAAAVEGGRAAEWQPAHIAAQEQQQGQQQQRRLTESLLAGLHAAYDGQQQQQEAGVSREQFTAAWVAAAAAVAPGSRQASINLDALEGSSSIDAGQSPFVAAQLAAAGGARPHARQSLEGAASLVFVAEMDDQAFLASMRTLSRSRPYGSSPSLQKLSSQQQQQQQQLAKQQNSYPRSAASVVSSTGSLLADAAAADTPAAGDRDYRRAATTGALGRQMPPAGMHVAFADDSSDASTEELHNRNSMSQLSGRVHSSLRPASSSSLLRFGLIASRSIGSFWGGLGSASQQQPKRSNSSSAALKPSISWADLAGQPAGNPASDAAGNASKSPAAAASEQQQQQQQQQPAVWDQAAPVTAAQLGLLVGRAKAILPAARLEPQWLRPRGFVAFDADAWAALLEDAELLLVRWGGCCCCCCCCCCLFWCS
jgi:hypothetical protein